MNKWGIRDEMFSFTQLAGGHEPVLMQLVGVREAWCPLCGKIVRAFLEDIGAEDIDARELFVTLVAEMT